MKQATPEMATVRAILAATVLLAILSAALGPGAMAESAGIPELYEGLVIPPISFSRRKKKQRRRKRKARSPAHRRHLRSRLWNLPRNPPRRPQASLLRNLRQQPPRNPRKRLPRSRNPRRSRFRRPRWSRPMRRSLPTPLSSPRPQAGEIPLPLRCASRLPTSTAPAGTASAQAPAAPDGPT